MADSGQQDPGSLNKDALCLFPKLNTRFQAADDRASVNLPFASQDLIAEFCQHCAIEPFQLLQVAWAVILQSFTASERPRFLLLDHTARSSGLVIVSLVLAEDEDEDVLDLVSGLQHREVASDDVLSRQTVNTAVTRSQSSRPSNELDVVVSARVDEPTWTVSLSYQTSTLADSQAVHVVDLLQHIVTELVCYRRLSAIRLCSPLAVQQIARWNSGELNEVNSCLHELIFQGAQRRPDAPAICAWDGNLTYHDIDSLSADLAQHLRSCGVGPGKFVGVYYEKSKWATVAILSIMRAGGAYFMLEPSFPVLRLKEICRQMSATLVLSSQQFRDRAAMLELDVLTLTEGKLESHHTVSSHARENLSSDLVIHSLNPLYAAFTSGSTGVPKGFVITHAAFGSSQNMTVRAMGLDCNSRMLQFSSHTWDVFGLEVLATLLAGGCVCVPSDQARRTNIPLIIQELRVNVAALTPTVARLIDPTTTPSLDTLMLLGEAVTPADLATWSGRVRLLNGYGPGECSPISAVHHYSSRDKHANIIGTAVGARYWITHPSDPSRLAPIGAIGELLIEGPGVGPGYVADVQKTKDHFIDCPAWRSTFPGKSYEPMYRTGDLVQYVADGMVRFVGRRDVQAKLRGQRLELSEVEHHLEQVLPHDTQVVVDIVVPSDDLQGPTLVGFVLLPQRLQSRNKLPAVDGDLFDMPTPEFQRISCAAVSALVERVPRYMVPSFLLQVTHMPLGITAKTDRRYMRECASQLTRQQLETFAKKEAALLAPSTPAEGMIHRMIKRVLRLEEFSMEDDFFQLGGDSILAMRLAAMAREEYGVYIAGDAVFKAPRLSKLALMIENTKLDDCEIPPFSLLEGSDDKDQVLNTAMGACGLSSAGEIEDIYPCTPTQEAIMGLSLTSTKWRFVTRSAFCLPRAIMTERLVEAWSKVVQSNPVLRTRIMQAKSGNLFQVVVDDGPVWQYWNSLEACTRQNTNEEIRLGDPLMRLSLVTDADVHYLILDVHHAIIDGWSLPQTLAQVEDAYYGGEPHTEPFKVFVKHVIEQDDKTAEEYWRRSLAGFSAPVFPRPPSDDHNYRPLTIQIMKHTAHMVSPRQLGVTTATIIKLAWAITLSHYSGTNDVVFGITVAGRSTPVRKIDQILGPTIATIPCRVQFGPDTSVKDLLYLLRDRSLEETAFEQIGLRNIAALGSDAATACRFQNLLVIQPLENTETSTIFNGIIPHLSRDTSESYALTIEAKIGRQGSLSLEAGYDPDVIPAGLMSRILNQFDHNLNEIAKGADKELRALTVPNTKDFLTLQGWNHLVPEAINCCIHDIVSRQAHSHPRKLAIVAWDGSMTYQELGTASSALACHLQSTGVQPGQYVMISMEKTLWVVVAIMAVLKAGGAFVLVDLAQPIMRAKQIRDETQAKIVLSTRSSSHHATSIGLRVIEIGGTNAFTRQQCTREPAVTPEHAAYAIFTSGSTGKPKGVVVEHRAFLTSAIMNGAGLFVNESSRVLQFASFTFDASIAEIFYPLVQGGCVCVASQAECRDNLEQAMNDYEISWASLTPSMARVLNPAKLKTLRTLALGGEAMAHKDVEMWAHRVQLVNGYGPAECCVDTSVQPAISVDADPANIGRGVAAVCWIVDPDNYHILKPIGAIGELVVEGPILARGYLNDPEKTANSFVKFPDWLRRLRHGKDGRLYRTGDLVRYSPRLDGSVHYIGRKDNQVKVRGQRLELGEVEQHVRECLAHVKEVVAEVVRSSDEGAEPSLVAFILFERNHISSDPEDDFFARVDPSVWHLVDKAEQKLRSRVPGYMVPNFFLPINRIPYSLSGKVDRRALRDKTAQLTRKELRAQHHLQAPKLHSSTEREVTLQKAVARVLRLRPNDVGMHDNFFSLGGDSIAATRLVAAFQDTPFTLSVLNVMTQPRLKDLASAVTSRVDKTVSKKTTRCSLVQTHDIADVIHTAASQCCVDESSIEDVYPCTPMQEALVALSMKQPGDYIARFVLELPQASDIGRVRKAWQAVYDSNSILRTRFVEIAGSGLFQVVLREELHFSSDPGPPRIGHGTVLNSFHLEHCGDHWGLHIWLHHALYDGFALANIMNQAENAYHGAIPVLHPYSPFVAYTESLDSNAAKVFWANEFKTLDTGKLEVLGRKIDTTLGRTSVTHDVSLPPVSESKSTLSTMIHLAFAIVLSHYTLSDDVVYGLTLSGRSAAVEGIDDLVGPTIATVPLRTQLSRGTTVRDSLLTLQTHLAQITQFEQFGLQNIRSINSETRLATEFQCHIVIQPSEEGLSTDNTIFRDLREENKDTYSQFFNSPLGLVCTVSQDKRELQLVSNFDVSCFDETQMMALSNQLECVLRQIVDSPECVIESIDVISPADVSRLATHNTVLPARSDRLVHDLIFEQCHSRPAKAAISSWDGNFTYQELERTVHRLTRHFVDLGIGVRSITPVCMERSCWTVVAVLAVLQAGSAVSLLDSEHPPARIDSIIRQTGAQFVITSPTTTKLIAEQHYKTLTVSESLVNTLSYVQNSPVDMANSRDPAFVLFTSGSSGEPKGIVMEHGSISTALRDIVGPSGLDEDSRVSQFSSYAFDAAILEIWGPLMTGGCLCIPSETTRKNDLAGFIRQQEVNWAFLIPSVSRLLEPSEVPSLRTLELGGEALTRYDVSRWGSKVSLINGYGPAECSIFCTLCEPSISDWIPGTIGPIVNGVGWIVSPSNPEKLAAWGAPGELLMEGHALAREYLGAPEKTNAAFLTNPPWLAQFRQRGQLRLYRTGDIVQYLSDGSLKFIGRKDKQIKLNGQRVELEEIESNLNSYLPTKASCVVELIVSPSHNMSPRLCCFVCLGNKKSDALEVSERGLLAASSESFLDLCRAITIQLSQVLPQYMIPRQYIELKYIPTVGSGKINRRLLIELASSPEASQLESLSTSSPVIVSAQNETEDQLIVLWADVLGIPAAKISIKDSFLSIGGDSIMAMRLVANARRAGLHLTVADVFSHPRLQDLASGITCSAQNSDGKSQMIVQPFSLLSENERPLLMAAAQKQCGVDSGAVEDVYPCTALQESLALLSMRSAGAGLACFRYRLPVDVDVSLFQQAWQEVSKANPILRTRIVQGDSLLQAVIDACLPWTIVDNLCEYISPLTTTELQIGQPLIQLCIEGSQSHSAKEFLLVAYHIIYDGWSLNLLLDQVQRAYEGQSPPTRPFNDFVDHVLRTDLQQCKKYWANVLADWRGPVFPTLPSNDYRPLPDTAITRHVAVEPLPGVTTATILQLAWLITISGFTGCSDVVCGLVLSGRNADLEDIESITGPTIATVPLRFSLDGAQSVRNQLYHLQKQLANMTPFEQFGLQNIAQLSKEVELACQFQNFLSIQPSTMASTSRFWQLVEDEHNFDVLHTYALSVDCSVSDDCVTVLLDFDQKVLKPRRAQQILSAFVTTIQQIQTDPDTIVSGLNQPLHLVKKDLRPDMLTRDSDSGDDKLEDPEKKDNVCRSLENGTLTSLQNIVADVLSIDPKDVEIEDDFFGLGGNSIMAIRFVKRAQAAGFHFRVTNVLQTPKLSQLAMVTSQTSKKHEHTNGDISARGIDQPSTSSVMQMLRELNPSLYVESRIRHVLPVTQAAERYIRLAPEYWVLNFQSSIDYDRLQSACAALVRRHGILRTVFIAYQGKFLQVVLHHLKVAVEKLQTTSNIADFVDDYRRNDMVIIPTVNEPITKFVFVQNSTDKQALIVRLSHAQFDGLSLPIIWQDLQQLFEGLLLSPAADYGAHMISWENSHTEEAYTYWRKILESSKVSRFDNTTFCDIQPEQSQSKAQSITANRQIKFPHANLRELTMGTIIKAAWAFLLAEITGQRDAMFVQYTNGRSSSSNLTRNVVGMCLNFVPVRMKLDYSQTVLDLMRFVQRQHHESLDFELLDFREIVEHATSWPTGTTHQSIVLHQNLEPDEDWTFGDVATNVTCSYEWPRPPDDIMVYSLPGKNGEMQLGLDTTSDILSQRHADLVVEKMAQIVSLFHGTPDKSLNEISTLIGPLKCCCENHELR